MSYAAVLPDAAAIAVSRLDGLSPIRDFVPTWESLIDADPAATVYQSPALFFAWLSTATGHEVPWLLVVSERGRPIGCAALVLRSTLTRGVRTRMAAFANPRGDVVAATRRDEVTAAVCGWLLRHAREWDVLALDDIRPETAQQIARCIRQDRRFAVESPATAPAEAYLDTSIGWDAYLRLRGSHFRKRLRPQTRRIERLGAVSVRRHVGPEAGAAYEEFLGLEARSWKARSGETQLPERERAAFRQLIGEADGRVEPDVLFLEVDQRPVAALLSLAHRHTYYLFVTYFDDTVRAHYPGRRLILEAIEYAFAQPQIRTLSFVGAYPFAMAWCDSTRDYCSLKVYGSGLRARWARSFALRQEQPRPEPATEAAHA